MTSAPASANVLIRVPKAARLDGAAVGLVLGIEVDDERLADPVAQANRAVVTGQRHVGHRVAELHGAHGTVATGRCGSRPSASSTTLPMAAWPTRRRGRRGAPVPADRDRAAHGARAHLGAGDGAVARDRRRLRHARRASTGTRGSPTAGRACSSSRRPASATSRRAAAAHRPRSLRRPGSRARRARCARRASGETLLFIQLIDFLAIRRRPAARQVLRAVPRDQPTRIASARAHAGDDWRRATTSVRARARRAARRRARARARRRASSRTSQRGYRERVTDMHLPHIARAAARAARPVRRRGRRARSTPASTASSCTSRTRTRWRRSCRR